MDAKKERINFNVSVRCTYTGALGLLYYKCLGALHLL